MAKTYETEQVQEKFLLAAVDLEDGTDVSYSLDELAELTETAGGIVVGPCGDDFSGGWISGTAYA